MTRCSAIGLLPQRATLATVASEAWGTRSLDPKGSAGNA